MKIALIHDWLPFMGGGERVLTNFTEIYEDAPIYTSVFNKKNIDDCLAKKTIITSFLQNKRGAIENHRKYFPFMPAAFESFNLNEYDIVLSSSSSVAKGVVTKPDTVHICYCHSPMRYAWEFYYEYADKVDISKIKRNYLKHFMNYMRIWDNVSADRVDYFIANSTNVAKRIWKSYRRESVVIHPPVRCNYFEISDKNEDYFLIVSRLQEYKRIDLAVETFNELGLPLVIIGDGPMKQKLQNIAKDNIKFLGRASDETIKEHFSHCRALIFPGEEDFGITPLEAMASGRPVIAYGKGGALETVVEGKTGLFFKEQTKKALIEAIEQFEHIEFDKQTIRKHAESFDESVFKAKIEAYVNECYEKNNSLKHWSVL